MPTLKAGVAKPAEYSDRRLPVNPQLLRMSRGLGWPNTSKTPWCERACLDSAIGAG